MHDVSLDDEYFPASHCLQSLDELDPAIATLLPAPHVMQLETLADELYLPMVHAVQLVAAVLGPLLVMLPAALFG